MSSVNRVYEDQQVEFQRCSCLREKLAIRKSQLFLHAPIMKSEINVYSQLMTPSKFRQKNRSLKIKLSKNLDIETDKKNDLCSTNMNTLCKTSMDNYEGILPQKSYKINNNGQTNKQEGNGYELTNNKYLTLTQSQFLDEKYMKKHYGNYHSNLIENDKQFDEYKKFRQFNDQRINIQTGKCRQISENSYKYMINILNNRVVGEKNYQNSGTTSFQTKRNISVIQSNNKINTNQNIQNLLQNDNQNITKRNPKQRKFDNHPYSLNIQDFSRVRQVETIMEDSFSISFIDVGSGFLGDSFVGPEFMINQKQMEMEMKRLLSN